MKEKFYGMPKVWRDSHFKELREYYDSNLYKSLKVLIHPSSMSYTLTNIFEVIYGIMCKISEWIIMAFLMIFAIPTFLIERVITLTNFYYKHFKYLFIKKFFGIRKMVIINYKKKHNLK